MLSAAVFFLGIISGREMVQGKQDQSQVVSVYPTPTGAPFPLPLLTTGSAAAPAYAATPRPSSRVVVGSENRPSTVLPKPSPEDKAPPHPAVANVLRLHRSTRTRHSEYKIVVGTAMGPATADRMAARIARPRLRLAHGTEPN
jgi:hypothetical protein